MVSYPRIPGHEVAATIVEMGEPHPTLAVGIDVTLSPYTSCGKCASCHRGRHVACESYETLGVQRNGALTEFVCVPLERLFPAKPSLEELGLVEPLTVGSHAAARGRMAGRVVYIGYAKEPVCYETRLFVQKELEILGSRNAQPEDFRQVIAMLEAGRFPVRETISTTVGLEQAPEIFAAWSAEPSRFTKIMIHVS
jgi:threonine dehydrogenase-like Zn-dependent dehydrogenase